MSFMESIRTKGQYLLLAFLAIFVVTLFFGLTGGSIFNPSQFMRKKPDGAAPDGQGRAALVPEGKLASASVLVNGQAVAPEIYLDFVRRFEEMLSQQKRDPSNSLTAYGYAVNALADQEARLQEAARLGLKVTDEDFAKAKADACASFLQGEAKSTGNVVGDLVKQYNDARALKAAFSRYLETVGMTEAQWAVQIRRELLANKVDETVKARLEGEEKAELDKRKAEVDAELAKGTAFAEVADKYSDDKGQSGAGGDMGFIGWSLLQDTAQRDAIWAVEKGKVSDWIEVEAGWQKVEVYDKKVAEGEAFEKEKPAVIKRLKDAKPGQSGYEPTEDEIRHEFEQVALRQIMLRKKAQQKVYEELDKLVKAARVEVNNAYALAWQAVNGDKFQAPADFGYDKLVELAKSNAAVGDGYDFSPLKAKIEKGQPVQAEAEADEAATPAADDAVEPVAGAAAAEADGSADAATEAPAGEAAAQPGAAGSAGEAAEAEPETVSMGAPAADPTVPLYALAIALLTKGLADDNGEGGRFAHYMIARLYMDWLADTARLKDQPIDRDKARQSMEDHLKAAAESDNYNAQVHAIRALNLAWLEKKEDAGKSFDLALQYVADDDTACFDTLREAAGVLDDKARTDALDAKISEARQRKLQEMLDQSMREGAANQAPGGAGLPPAN